MPHYCPHCNNEIDHLKYEADYTEWGHEFGTCALDGSDWTEDDREANDSENSESEYRCPDCEELLAPEDVLDEEPDDDDDEENEDEDEDEDETTELTDGGNTVRPVDNNRVSATKQTLTKSQNCPECGTLNFPDGDQTIICNNCNHEIIIN